MDAFRVVGGNRISGKTKVHAAKNACLPIMAASLMAEGEVTLCGCPNLTDIANMRRILEALGAVTYFRGDEIHIFPGSADTWEVPQELTGRLRSSIFVMGPMMARFRRAKIAYPGGCDIGQRPIDLHLKGLTALGATIREENGMIFAETEKLRGGETLLDFPSVGATENIMMAASLSPGRSVILNAAREPEIVDLARFINAMGGRIDGAGESRIVIEGVSSLKGIRYRPTADRIVAGTLLIAGAITGGCVEVEGARISDMYAVTGKLRECGCRVVGDENLVRLEADRPLHGVNIATQPYPGFPTDLQSPMLALMTTAQGTSIVTENVFENRFGYVSELRRMGADATVVGRSAVVNGGRLRGARVRACDLRAGAALTVAALAAEGETLVTDVGYIDRGYDRLETTLRPLGAAIERVEEYDSKEMRTCSAQTQRKATQQRCS